MNKPPKLDKWVTFNDVLIGRVYDHPGFENGQRVQTNMCTSLDEKIGVAICVAGEVWQLGEPGSLSMYEDPVTKKFY